MSAFYPIMLSYASTDIEARINGRRSLLQCFHQLYWGNCGHSLNIMKVLIIQKEVFKEIAAKSAHFPTLLFNLLTIFVGKN